MEELKELIEQVRGIRRRFESGSAHFARELVSMREVESRRPLDWWLWTPERRLAWMVVAVYPQWADEVAAATRRRVRVAEIEWGIFPPAERRLSLHGRCYRIGDGIRILLHPGDVENRRTIVHELIHAAGIDDHGDAIFDEMDAR